MSEAKWSPGPWHPGHLGNPDLKCECAYILDEGHAGGIGEVYINNGKPIADGGNDAPEYEEAVANMHLIATAPELYEALDALMRHDLEMIACGIMRPFIELERAQAVLAKARRDAIRS